MNGFSETVPEALQAFFRAHPKIALAFSGGSDSAYLLYAARLCGAEVGIYYVKSAFQAAFEYADAVRLTQELGGEMHILCVDVLSDEAIAKNPENRCYFCKKCIFTEIISAAHRDGYDTVIDGTNASDDFADRPGMRALAELQVLSPLRICGITKAEVRAHSKKAGIFTWNKPAYACLATRIPQGMVISQELLSRVENAEDALAKLGFRDFRVRLTADLSAKIQLTKTDMALFSKQDRAVYAALKDDFADVLLDLRFRGE